MAMAAKKSGSRKVVVPFIIGATGSGKTKLSVSLAAHFNGEIINSDKIQVYKGLDVLDVLTNKVTSSEAQGIRHHLIGEVDPDVEFTAKDFIIQAISAIGHISGSGKVPIVVGGSDSFIEALVLSSKFKSKCEPCFIWLDVAEPVLDTTVPGKVDLMVKHGLVDEVRGIFDPKNTDYTKGIRKAIGVPEMDKFLRAELSSDKDSFEKQKLLESAIAEIIANAVSLISRQVAKIRRFAEELGWPIHRINSTAVFEIDSDKEAQNALWKQIVFNPSVMILEQYIKNNNNRN